MECVIRETGPRRDPASSPAVVPQNPEQSPAASRQISSAFDLWRFAADQWNERLLALLYGPGPGPGDGHGDDAKR